MLDEPGGVEAQFLGQFNLIEHLAIDLSVRSPGAVGYLQVEGPIPNFMFCSPIGIISALDSATKSVLVRISEATLARAAPVGSL
jgi:hypothetical protein